MSDRRYRILLNARSGAALGEAVTPDGLLARFAACGLSATIDGDHQLDLAERIAAAVQSEADTIVAAGGDGTVTAVAAALIGTDKTLALLPLGTANLLARDLGVPLGIDEAIRGLPAMRQRRIDVGEVNGRIFLHKIVVGFAPQVAAGREALRDSRGLGARLGFLRFFLARIRRPQRLTIDLTLGPGRRIAERVRTVAVANNAYDEGFGRVFARRRLDAGHLSIYILKRFGLLDLLRLSAGMLVGRWRRHAALTIETSQEAELKSRRRLLQVMIDGEVERFQTPLRFRIRPLALSVLAPADLGPDGAEP